MLVRRDAMRSRTFPRLYANGIDVITGRNRRELEPVLKRYDRICFEREAIQPTRQTRFESRCAHASWPSSDAVHVRHASGAAYELAATRRDSGGPCR